MLVRDAFVKEYVAKATQQHLKEKSVAKRTAVRLAIAEAIKNKVLAPGDRLPAERELVDICGVSLGTVQAALSQLSQFDLIERKRGSGTIVRRRDVSDKFGDHVWHFRFHSLESKRPLRVLATRMQMDRTSERADCVDVLGESDGLLRVRRHFQMSEGITAYSEMFLHPETAPRLQDQSDEELWVVNIRTYLDEEFGIKTVSSEHSVTLVQSPDVPFDGAQSDVSANWFKVTARAYDAARNPVYVQEIYARADQCIPNFNSGPV